MLNTRAVKIDGVGPVLFERSRRARRVNISVKSFRGVRVAVPYRVSFNKAEAFVRTKVDWIKKQSEKMKQYEKGCNLNSGVNETVNKEEAKKVLTRRLKQLADKYGFVYNRLFFRNQRTRWGSCSHKNNISLNMKLILLSEDLMDYVILHELVHTHRKDHSQTFWAEMDKLVGDGKEMSSRLRKYGIRLF